MHEGQIAKNWSTCWGLQGKEGSLVEGRVAVLVDPTLRIEGVRAGEVAGVMMDRVTCHPDLSSLWNVIVLQLGPCGRSLALVSKRDWRVDLSAVRVQVVSTSKL